MFAAHKAQINISRSEPTGLNIDEAIKIVKDRNHEYATEVVTKSLLKKRTKNKERSQRKIMKHWENDERRKRCDAFVEAWNYWRSFYIPDREFQRWEPKNSGQLTVIENILKFANEKEIDVGMLIATTWKNFQNSRRFTPTIQMCLSNAVDYYNQWHKDVIADIRDAEYIEDALL